MESWPQDASMRESRSRHAIAAPAEGCEMPGFCNTVAANDPRSDRLARTIEQEIIPRLLLAHRTAGVPLTTAPGRNYAITAADVEQFTRLVLAEDHDIALLTVQKLRARQVPVEALYLDLFAPTARRLGKLWEDDDCSFTDVTLGLGRLQRLLRELGPALGERTSRGADDRRVLLLPAPGEQHTFGLVMVAEFFRRAGWQVAGGAWANDADGLALARTEWFDVIGFAISAEIHVERLAEAIAALRHGACNPELRVIVGGPLIAASPELAARLGADAMTIDGREAPTLAESLLPRRTSAEVQPG